MVHCSWSLHNPLRIGNSRRLLHLDCSGLHLSCSGIRPFIRSFICHHRLRLHHRLQDLEHHLQFGLGVTAEDAPHLRWVAGQFLQQDRNRRIKPWADGEDTTGEHVPLAQVRRPITTAFWPLKAADVAEVRDLKRDMSEGRCQGRAPPRPMPPPSAKAATMRSTGRMGGEGSDRAAARGVGAARGCACGEPIGSWKKIRISESRPPLPCPTRHHSVEAATVAARRPWLVGFAGSPAEHR